MLSSARARYVRAQELLRNAEETEENARRSTDAATSGELSVAKNGVVFARREVADAGRAYAADVKADLMTRSPEFARLVRNAEEANEAAASAHRLFRAIRDVYHAASKARPAGFCDGGDTELRTGAQAYAKICSRIFRLHGQALSELKGELETLISLATDAEGRVQDALGNAAKTEEEKA